MKPSKASSRKPKDLPAKSTSVKGGGLNQNDNMTLMRAAKAGNKAKDLAPKTPGRVKGGSKESPERLSANDNVTLVRAKKPAKRAKDLPPTKASGAVKGGGKDLNDNMTLVRGAKPTAKKKDLPGRKDVSGGNKRL